MGLEPDTHISGNQFSQLVLLFYITYLAFEFPSGYLMQRLPTAKYLGANVCLWGVFVAATSAAHDWATLVALRVLLGCFEAVVAPAMIVITTMWYKKSEQPLRIGFWYLGSGTGSVIGALTSYGFQHYETTSSFNTWQIMFLIFGLLTVAVGLGVMFIVPDNPMTARGFSRDEKVWAITRLRENKTGVENKHFKFYQVVECFSDPQVWLIGLITCSSMVPNGAISSFQATIIQGFGYSSEETALLSIPGGVVTIIFIIIGSWLATKYGYRGPLIIMFLLLGGCLGGCLMAFVPEDNRAAKLAGIYLTVLIGPSLPLLYSYASANIAGHTKKVTMNAFLLISFCEPP